VAVNPVPLVFWLVVGGLLGLAPRLLLGWSWWASLGAGLILAPPLLWLVGAILDRIERREGVAAPPAPVPPLVLEAPEPCPRCGSTSSAIVLYGLPAFTKELERAIEDGRVVLAGCLTYAGAPRWICRQCGEKHGLALPEGSGG